ncbi:SEC-C metal-binding domain-containing protein [Rheinheimera aquimaris]|uniref:SEC-C metal-binding domain-containing protein n=1 Tax=Rheinheimera aquimaris TaxID=412437 RepID=UPI00197DF9F6|nr:SEC-C metal-binding domain-containing protein [Rheinheimera aquimaris]
MHNNKMLGVSTENKLTNNRNLPCPCGSGKKYEKCCLNRGLGVGNLILSEELKGMLDTPCWYHGSDQKFNKWEIPPPEKPNEPLLVAHTALFFTSNLSYAEKAGKNIAGSSLSSKAKILDTTANYDACEKLRIEFSKHPVASRTYNANHDFWHEGWRTGHVLRMAYNDPAMEIHLQQMAHDLTEQTGLPLEATLVIIQHNSSRGLIELICNSAQKLGFDALYGHEVDRHSDANKVIAQPILAVLSKGIMSEPDWVA